MKNEQPPRDPGEAWNSNNQEFGNLTGDQVSRMLSFYVNIMRTIADENLGVDGIASTVMILLAKQRQLCASSNCSEKEKEFFRETEALAVLAAGLAGITAVGAIGKIDPRYLAGLGVAAMDAVSQLSAKIGPPGPDDILKISVAKGGENEDGEKIKMMVSMIPDARPPKPDAGEKPVAAPENHKPYHNRWEPGMN